MPPPPVGERRFRPPDPAEPWSELRDARTFGPSSWQNAGGLESVLGGAEMVSSEDCLTLNVQTPACDDGARPVLVWFHGGGFTSGTSATPWYDGASFVRRGDVVVVSVNYRLGALGFLWLGALGDEYRSSGVNGILDQAAALRWVHDEIASFGGDPGNVTIFGESAGAMSVGTLLALPAAQGLFHRAIAQSGAAHNTFEPRVAEEITSSVLAELGLRSDEELLELAPEQLVSVEAAVTRQLFRNPARISGRSGISLAMPFQPVVDGRWLPEAPLHGHRRRLGVDRAGARRHEPRRVEHVPAHVTRWYRSPRAARTPRPHRRRRPPVPRRLRGIASLRLP